MELRTRIADIALGSAVVLTLLTLSVYFSELFQSDGSNPFRQYNENEGIIQISGLKLFTAVLTLLFLTGQPFLKMYSRTMTVVLVIGAITIGLLTWTELWYGSTFYYGEVRDKQGVGFPFLTLIFFVYPIWKVQFKSDKLNSWKTKTIATVLIVIGAYLFFGEVEEPWKLWQS